MVKPFLAQMLHLAEINPELRLERNLNGKFLRLLEKDRLEAEWRFWKNEKLQKLFLSEKEQNKFVENYEKGFKKLEESLKSNLQYLLLLPEIYGVIFPPNKHFLLLTDPLTINSRLVNGMIYEYQLKLVKLEEYSDKLELQLHSQLNNLESLILRQLTDLYQKADG